MYLYLQIKAARLGIQVGKLFRAMAPWLLEAYLRLVETHPEKSSKGFDVFAEAAIKQHEFMVGKAVALPDWLNFEEYYESLPPASRAVPQAD
ncbi:MAG: hypothetical protein SGARI_006299, partial [Bacillariaceae sp.]